MAARASLAGARTLLLVAIVGLEFLACADTFVFYPAAGRPQAKETAGHLIVQAGSAPTVANATAAVTGSGNALSVGILVAGLAAAAAQRNRGRRRAAAPMISQTVTADDFTDVCDRTGITLSRYMLEMRKRGVLDEDMTCIMNSIREASKVIAKLVNTAPLKQAELLGLEGEVNVQGEDQKKLDVITNEVFKNALKYSGKLGTLASEEEDEPVIGSSEVKSDLPLLSDAFAETGKYVCVFDPLDGSSNVDAGMPVGTIFGVFKEPDTDECELPEGMGALTPAQAQCLAGTLQPGNALVASGYVLYSASTEFVLTIGHGVVGFSLDTTIGEFVLTRPSIKIPSRGSIYSMNQGNILQWDKPMIDYVEAISEGKGESGKKYSLRYIGSMVGDIHRTLLYGGIFAYPSDKKNIDGKLRLLYEGAPMAMIMEQAGGKAVTGHSRVLDIPPVKVHQRVPVILGSKEDVEECQKYYFESDDATLKQRCENRMNGVTLS